VPKWKEPKIPLTSRNNVEFVEELLQNHTTEGISSYARKKGEDLPEIQWTLKLEKTMKYSFKLKRLLLKLRRRLFDHHHQQINQQYKLNLYLFSTYLMPRTQPLKFKGHQLEHRQSLHEPKVARKSAPVSTGVRKPHEFFYHDEVDEESQMEDIIRSPILSENEQEEEKP
jgi:hypothetical protein